MGFRYKLTAILLISCSILMVYTLRWYTALSALYVLSWLFFLGVAAHFRSTIMSLAFGVIWLLAFFVFLYLVQLPSVYEIPLPLFVKVPAGVFLFLFLLPLGGLPFMQYLCLPLALLFAILGGTVYGFLKRATTKNKGSR